jgi:hypothetical protein
VGRGDRKRPHDVFAELLPTNDWKALAKPLYEALRNGLAHKFDTEALARRRTAYPDILFLDAQENCGHPSRRDWPVYWYSTSRGTPLHKNRGIPAEAADRCCGTGTL